MSVGVKVVFRVPHGSNCWRRLSATDCITGRLHSCRTPREAPPCRACNCTGCSDDESTTRQRRPAASTLRALAEHDTVRRSVLFVSRPRSEGSAQGGYIFYAGASLAGAGYCRQCRRRPAILPLQLWQGCQVCVKIFRPTTSRSSPILRLLSSHWATSVVRTRVVGVANVGDSLRRLKSLQHRIYNLLGSATPWTYFLHLSLSSVILIDSSTGSPVHVLMLSMRGLSRQRALPCFLMQ